MQPVAEFGERFGVQVVDAMPAAGPIDDQACLFEHGQVLGDRRAAQGELRCQITGRGRLLGEKLEQPTTDRIGESQEHSIVGGHARLFMSESSDMST